jgi:hypothetical protein
MLLQLLRDPYPHHFVSEFDSPNMSEPHEFMKAATLRMKQHPEMQP